MRVFISYAHQDERFVKQLQRDLQARGIDTFATGDQIAPGSSWVGVVSAAIETSDVVLVAISKNSARSGALSVELAFALSQKATEAGKRVIPLLVEPDAQPPFFLREAVYVDLSSEQKYAPGLDRLVEAILHPGPDSAGKSSRETKEELLGQQMELLERERKLWEMYRSRMMVSLRAAISAAATILLFSLLFVGVLWPKLPKAVVGVLAGGVVGYLSRDLQSLLRSWARQVFRPRREG
jgi:TIR domain-containing protein